MKAILCIGEPLGEFVRRADGLWEQGFGGDASNVAIAAARLGAKASIFTRVGADFLGDGLLALWAEEGVDASAVIRDAAASTGAYLVTGEEGAHRFSYARAGSAASRMTADELPRDAIAAAALLHVSAIGQAISASASEAVLAAMRFARAEGVPVCFDTNLRLRLWPLEAARPAIFSALALADIARPSLDDAQLLTGLDDPDAIADRFLAFGPSEVALTLGAEGVLVATRDRRERIAGLKIKAVDATGAGDAFDGAYLAERAAGRDCFAAARFANAAAALSTLRRGALSGLPRRAEVERALATGHS